MRRRPRSRTSYRGRTTCLPARSSICFGCARDVQKKLSTKLRQSKPLACLPTVENDGARGRLTILTPFGQNPPVIGEQRHPEADLAGSVPRPVIRRDQPRVQAVGIAEKG